MRVRLKSGAMSETVVIPDHNLVGVLEPPELPQAPEQTSRMINEAIECPIGGPGLESLLEKRRNVAIVVDDISRPTPTKDILKVLLSKLREQGITNEHVTITVANGLHRRTTDQEKVRIVGEEVFEEFDVADSNADDKEAFDYIGTTTNNTPIFINKRVVQADVVITIGMIRCHGIAGFTGGAKSIVPGVSAKQTVLSNHRFDFIEYPKGIVGDADLSYMRRDMEEAAQMVPVPLFIINVVLDSEKNIRGVFAGDVIRAHRKGVELFRQMAQVDLEEQADVILIEANYPSSESLYFALAGLAMIMSAKKPAVRPGGSVILYAECKQGVGADVIQDLFNSFESPDALLEHLRSSAPVEQQWAAQRLAFYVRERDVCIVTQGLEKQDVEQFRMKYFRKLQQGIDEMISRHGDDAKILIIKKPDFLLLEIK